jgi:hypothetical protein
VRCVVLHRGMHAQVRKHSASRLLTVLLALGDMLVRAIAVEQASGGGEASFLEMHSARRVVYLLHRR